MKHLFFISSLVPDKEAYRTTAFSRSGNNVLEGIAESIPESIDLELVGLRPIAPFPQGKLWLNSSKETLFSNRCLSLWPVFNLKIVKDIFWGLLCFNKIRKWRAQVKGETAHLLMYNIYSPFFPFIYWACRLNKIQIYVILYDLGVPPKRLHLGGATMTAYKLYEYIAKHYIPKIDGRIIINEKIIDYYAPGKDYLLIDGGVNNAVVNRLFPLKLSSTNDYVFVCAGMLWDQNGTRLILDAMKLIKAHNIRILFAGRGNDVPLIEQASKNDARIIYLGMLSMDQLFGVYENADVLLNLRIEEKRDFHFPSKLLEYMATGKTVVSTPIAHAERDYGDYIEILRDVTGKGLASLILKISKTPKDLLLEKGRCTRNFIVSKRTWSYRTAEILKYMEKDEQN